MGDDCGCANGQYCWILVQIHMLGILNLAK